MWENPISTCIWIKLDPYITPYTKFDSKWIKDLNVILETVKLLEENIGEKLHDIRQGSDFLAITPKAQMAKQK